MIIGKLWIDNFGQMEILNRQTGDKCCLTYVPQSFFSLATPRKVNGHVESRDGTYKWLIKGVWDEKVEASRVTLQSTSDGKPIYETHPSQVLWERKPINPEAQRYYCFTEFASQLNEPEEGVCPTDSRHRPDQRLMERGLWE